MRAMEKEEAAKAIGMLSISMTKGTIYCNTSLGLVMEISVHFTIN